MKTASMIFSIALPRARRCGGGLPITLALGCCSLALAGALPPESWPLPGRNVVAGGATLFLEFSGAVDTTCDITISGSTVTSASRGNCKLVAPLPKRDCFIYVEHVAGRGDISVLQDPREANGYHAILRVRDAGAGRGNHTLRAHYSWQPPERPPFSSIIRIPGALQPHYTSDGRLLAPAEPQPLPRSRYGMPGRLWGEQPGPVRSLIDPGAAPAFRWQGRVDQYAVLAFDGARIRLFDCGLPGARTLGQEFHAYEGSIQDCYLVLSECTSPGRVRVIQPGSATGMQDAYLIEIDNREMKPASVNRLTGHLLRKEVVDRWHRPDVSCATDWDQATAAELSQKTGLAAERWISVATRARDEDARLWALEKFCLQQPYPGPAPNPQEEKMLNILQNQAATGNPQLSDASPRAGPEQLLEVLPGRNVILAWPKDYTARVPTKWRFLAELDAGLEWLRVWTGNDEVRRKDMRMIARFRVDAGGTVPDASSYAEAASLYFVLMDHFCRTPGGELDWLKLSDLFTLARRDASAQAGAAERWQLLARLSEKAFGPETCSILAALGVPLSGPGN